MNRSCILIPTALLLVGAASQAGAQAPATPDSATIEAAKRVLKSDLRNFVVAQESYFADHGTYARSLRGILPVFKPTAGITVVLLTASDTAHSEIALDPRVPGLVCAMYVGNVPPPLGTGEEGEVVCRDP